MATITYYLSPISLIIQFFSNIGITLQNGFVYTYVAGTTTPVATYTDSTGTTPNQNPIALSSAGRLQSVGGAPVAVWLPSGVAHKMVVTDSGGNFILALDNLTGINDPASLITILSTVSTGSTLGGADVVANAMRSYDVIASVRAAQPPALAAGQTLVIDVEGGVLVNDGNGGIFYWSATSTAADDGATVICPTAILPANPGRFLRQTNLYGTAGSFTMTAIGMTTSPTMVVNWVRNGAQVTLSYAGVQGTSNSTSFSLSGFPISLRSVTNINTSCLMPAGDNSANGVSAYWTIQNQAGGNVVLTINNASGLWTASGTKGLNPGSFTYIAI